LRLHLPGGDGQPDCALEQPQPEALRQFRLCVRPEFFRGFDAMHQQMQRSAPCRVVWGEGDPYVPVRYARSFAKAAVTVLPRVGHWVPLVAPDELAAAVSSFDAGETMSATSR